MRVPAACECPHPESAHHESARTVRVLAPCECSHRGCAHHESARTVMCLHPQSANTRKEATLTKCLPHGAGTIRAPEP